MSTTFFRARRSSLGYDVEQVEDFLEDARQAYAAEPGTPIVVTAATIRQTSFAMKRGGYSAPAVDAALERLEDAFSTREREVLRRVKGLDVLVADARGTAQEILDRLARPTGGRFHRVGVLSSGYHPADVDAFADRLATYFTDGTPVTVEDVRAVAFRPRRGGYREAQVDLVLDTVVDVMLAVRV